MPCCTARRAIPSSPAGRGCPCCCRGTCGRTGWTWCADGMCGIAGLLNLRGHPIDSALLRRMTETLAHRGPDALAVWVRGDEGQGDGARGGRGDGATGNVKVIDLSPRPPLAPSPPRPVPSVGLGHTRLRIIDVAGGGPPTWDEDRAGRISFTLGGSNFSQR